jgi:hypothetical protein
VSGAGEDGLAPALVGWMADNRAQLDALMAEEASFAIHEEFMLAEGGTLPDRATRIERARSASARAWMRHLGRGITAVWPEAEADLAERLERWAAAHRERREALLLEEQAVAERRGASGDPRADLRDAELAAHCRFFAETLATVAAPIADSGESAPEFAGRVSAWSRGHEAWRREIEAQARAAWGAATHPGAEHALSAAESAPELDETRVQEAAAVWAHVRVLAEALGHVLTTHPGAPA